VQASRSLVLAVSLKQQNTSEMEYQIFASPNHCKTILFLCNEIEWNVNVNFFVRYCKLAATHTRKSVCPMAMQLTLLYS